MSASARVLPRLGVLASLALLGAAPIVGGCSVTQNVRAYRAYANEEPSIRVAMDRVEDLDHALELVDRILLESPYTPGDLWVRRLPLREADARPIRDELHTQNPYNSGDYEVPVLKVYCTYLETVFREYAPPPEAAKYPSILDAVNGLVPRAQVKLHWQAYRDATLALGTATEDEARLRDELASMSEADQQKHAAELADKERKTSAAAALVEGTRAELQNDAALLSADASLNTGDRAQVVREALTALSVAFRLELEALALAPVIAVQTIRAIPQAPKELFKTHSGKVARQFYQLPGFIAGIKERFTRQIPILEAMTTILAKAEKQDVDDTDGFLWKESVVDQIVGITLDSFRVDMHAGGQAFIYSNIQLPEESSSSDGKTKISYAGRQFKLDYRIQPIILASADLSVSFDYINLPDAGFLRFGYATDRAWKSGGDLTDTSLASQLGIHGAFSDVLDFGLGLLGVQTSARIAQFDAGTVRKVSATDASNVLDKAPLQLKFTQIDIGYDILFALGDSQMKAWMEQLVVGVRYYKYTLPRILYELTNVSADPNVQDFRFSREAPPQPVQSIYYMGGFNARFGLGEAPLFSPFLDLSMYAGAGPTSYYFLKDPTTGDIASNRDNVSDIAFVFNGGIGLGLRWRLLPRGSRVRLDLRALYRADVVYSQIHRSNADNGAERRVDFGSVDVFHGPTIAIRGAL